MRATTGHPPLHTPSVPADTYVSGDIFGGHTRGGGGLGRSNPQIHEVPTLVYGAGTRRGPKPLPRLTFLASQKPKPFPLPGQHGCGSRRCGSL